MSLQGRLQFSDTGLSRRPQPLPRPRLQHLRKLAHQRRPLQRRPRQKPSQDQRRPLPPRPKLPQSPKQTQAPNAPRRLQQLYVMLVILPPNHITNRVIPGTSHRRREESSRQDQIRSRDQVQAQRNQRTEKDTHQESRCAEKGRVGEEGYTQEGSRGPRCCCLSAGSR